MDLTSNEPFWLVKNGLVYAYPSLKENIETDILIVGGGITGALMANQCIEDGYKTTLIDRREIANGSSSATTSMLQYEIDTPLYKLIEMIGKEGAEANYWAGIESIETLQKLVKKIKSDCGFEVKESLFYAAFKKDLPDLIKEFEARKAAGFEVTWLEEEEIEKKYNLHQTHGGILSKKGGSIDAFRFVHDLLQYNLQKGLAVFDKTNTESTTYQNDKVIVTTDYGNTITANKVIYCNGYESTEMIKEKFVDLLSSYVIISEPIENIAKNINNTLFWDTAEPYIYLRTTDDNRLFIGGLTILSALVIQFRMPKQIEKEKLCFEIAELMTAFQNQENILLIDVRNESEFENAHIPSAIHIPLEELECKLKTFDPKVILITVCAKGGGRSEKAANLLKENQFNAYWLCEGTEAWILNNKSVIN